MCFPRARNDVSRPPSGLDGGRPLAHPALSAYAGFLARSARSGSTSGARASGRTEAFPVCLSNSRSRCNGAVFLVRLEGRLRDSGAIGFDGWNGRRSGNRKLGKGGSVSIPCRGSLEPGRHETCAATRIRNDWNFPVSKPMACRAATLANVSASPASGHTSSCGASSERARVSSFRSFCSSSNACFPFAAHTARACSPSSLSSFFAIQMRAP